MSEQKKVFLWVAGAIVLVFAIAIPLQRPRMSGPPAPGASMVRSLNTAQITYSTTYPKRGFAPDLAALGPGSNGICDPSNACLMDADVACPTGTGEAWCVKGMYRFNIQSNSNEPPYRDYWITATPVSPNPKLKNYCSASDAVIRAEQKSPLTRPYSLKECQDLPFESDSYHP